MGALSVDYDGDGWTDIFVANDNSPNFLYRNNGTVPLAKRHSKQEWPSDSMAIRLPPWEATGEIMIMTEN